MIEPQLKIESTTNQAGITSPSPKTLKAKKLLNPAKPASEQIPSEPVQSAAPPELPADPSAIQDLIRQRLDAVFTSEGSLQAPSDSLVDQVLAWFKHPNQNYGDSVSRYWKRRAAKQSLPKTTVFPPGVWRQVMESSTAKFKDETYIRAWVGFCSRCDRTWTPEACARWIATETISAELTRIASGS